VPSSIVDQRPPLRAALRQALPAAAVAAFEYFPGLNGLERLVLDNLAAPVSRSRAARLVGFQPSAFSRYFVSKTGMTFVEWLTTLRIAYATSLIETQSVSLAVLAARCGFADERALRRAFVRVHGICPRGYRQRLLFGDRSEPSTLSTGRSNRFPGGAMRGRAMNVRKLVAVCLMVGAMTMTSVPAEVLSTLGSETMGQTFTNDFVLKSFSCLFRQQSGPKRQHYGP